MEYEQQRKKPIKRRTSVLDILIAHDDEIVRIGLHALLKDHPAFLVCGETSTTSETVKEVEKLQPRILLIKLDLPDKGAIGIIPELLERRPGLKILLYATEGATKDVQFAVLTPTLVERALRLGVLGLVLKPDAQEIGLALDALSKDKSFISSNIFEGITSHLKHRIDHLPSLGDLTPREAEVFKLMAIGRTTREMATNLHSSPRTIEVHRRNIMRKLGLHSHSDLILFALQHKVVTLPSTPAAV